MSDIRQTAELVILARREGMEEAAAIVERIAHRLLRRSERLHKKWMNDEIDDCVELERLECEASFVSGLAHKIRRAAKRKPRHSNSPAEA